MNFKRSSLFQRNMVQEVEETWEAEGGVLAVWGSPSSGKTVVSVKLAEYLAKKEEKTCSLFCRYDSTAASPVSVRRQTLRGAVAWQHPCGSTCDRKPDPKKTACSTGRMTIFP